MACLQQNGGRQVTTIYFILFAGCNVVTARLAMQPPWCRSGQILHDQIAQVYTVRVLSDKSLVRLWQNRIRNVHSDGKYCVTRKKYISWASYLQLEHMTWQWVCSMMLWYRRQSWTVYFVLNILILNNRCIITDLINFLTITFLETSGQWLE